MKNVFASTTSLLATEFVEKFSETKLNATLSKVSRKTGVKFSRNNTTISIFGLWPWVLEAHDILLVASNVDNVSDDEQADQEASLNDSADLKSSCQAKAGEIPEPVIYYEYKDQALVGNDIMDPATLVDVVNSAKTVGEATSLKKIITEKYNKSIESAVKVSSDVESTIKNEIIKKEENADLEVKVEENSEEGENDEATGLSIYGGDTDDLTDTEIAEGVAEGNKRRSSRIKSVRKRMRIELKKSEKLGQSGEKVNTRTSRRKSTPQKYISPEKVDAEQESDLKDEGENNALPPPVTKKNVKTRKKSRKKRIPNADGTFSCDECAYVGKGKTHLREHIKRQHGIRFKCDQCDRSFGYNKDLKRHQRTVHVAAEYFCEECNRFYKSKRVFDDHNKRHQTGYVKPSHDCKLCDKTFSTKYVLATHIKAEHLGMKRSFLCPTCGRSFTQKNSYRQHANVHAGIRPYVCDICGKSFTYEKSLREHKFLHDKIRRFQCEVCEKTFLQSTSLRIHMKVHQEVRDYMCTSCGKGFTQKQALMRHERIHSGDKPFSCSLCEKTFSDYSIIRRHMILIHKKDPKKWQEDIVSHVKKKQDYYIDGGPGHHYRSSEKVKTQSDYMEEAVDKAIKEISDAAINDAANVENKEIGNELAESKQTVTIQEEKKTYCELENYPEMQPTDTVNRYQSHSYGDPHVIKENSQSSSVNDKVGVIKDTSMPINYSIQPNSSYSPNVSVGHTQDHISQESAANRYQQIEDMYSRDLQHQRGLYTPASTPDQMRSQLHGFPYPTPVTADQGQMLHGQPAHNQWSFFGYPPYYNPANFSQYQGPQN